MKHNSKYVSISTYRSNTRAGGPLRELAIDAAISGATIKYVGDLNIYYIDPDVTSAEELAQVAQVPGTTVDNFYTQRYIAVDDLSSDLPSELPGSSVYVSEDEQRQLTWQEVLDLKTVSVSPIEGVYYMNVTAHQNHRGLTLDELESTSNLPLLKSSELPVVEDIVN